MRLAVTALLIVSSTSLAAQDMPMGQSHAGMAGMNHGDMAAPRTPQIMAGYGSGGFPITTTVPAAQAFFNNGMQLAHAFAHKASIAAFAEAVRHDPACAMCLWGEAWASGPTINYGKTADELTPLAAMADKAAGLAATAGTPRERALIAAVQRRYHDGGGGKPGDLRFAKAMQGLVGGYPTDNEVAVLAADAWLQAPGKSRGQMKQKAERAMTLLVPALQRDPNDTAAIHFYIHATEIAGVPALAEPYADRLGALAPRASHLVHMPSHTYYWVGRYQDAANANMRAVEIGIENAKALGLPPPDGVWGLPYHAHNVLYGLGGALEAGDAKTALALGRPLVARAAVRTEADSYSQLLAANGYYAEAMFADPAEVLALPKPKLPITAAAWHYARGEAFARQGDVAGVHAEAAAIEGLPGKLSADDGSLQADAMTRIARNVLAGRAAMIEKRSADAASAFRRAAQVQEGADFSDVSDPPAWAYPVRRDLAAALLAGGDRAGARAEAEKALAYRVKDPGTLELLRTIDG